MTERFTTACAQTLLLAVAIGSSPSRGLCETLDAATAAVSRYISCVNAYDLSCIKELSLWVDDLEHSRSLPGSRFYALAAESVDLFDFLYWRVDTGAPIPVSGSDDRLYVIVPYAKLVRQYQWTERIGYLVGVSEDGGASWRFADDAMNRRFDNVVPGYRGPPLPEVATEVVPAPRLASSPYLRTARAGIVPRGDSGDGNFELTFYVRRNVSQNVPLVIVFENPADPQRPYAIDSVLARGQEVLHISSPLISGFLDRAEYQVLVYGIDVERDDVLFRHYQSVQVFLVPGLDGIFLPGTVSALPSNRRQDFILEYGLDLIPEGGGTVLYSEPPPRQIEAPDREVSR